MKRIARKEGASTDTSKDHVFTNWEALDGFVAELVDELVDQAGARDD
jgi:menaquinone-dependent protoporphyrinogen IX oxidase